MKAKQYIVAAAVKEGTMTCSMPRPARHHNILRQMAEAGMPIPIIGEQGFLTSDGLFVGRHRAKVIAVEASQIIGTRDHDELFSEDVW